ncbi:MAG: hypothetical protein R3286_04500 [Gammaproteobacteria bacterium]|nr:hypothetical protein [Gammaproteobacteria bacterium]
MSWTARSAELLVDGQGLLVPHQHIHSVEPILDLERAVGPTRMIGELSVADHRWPVYCIDRNLDVLGEIPPGRRACVLLRGPRGGFGILCDEVHVVDNEELRMVPLPGCMQGGSSLVDALAVVETKVVCVLSVQRLAAMLDPDEPLDDIALGAGDDAAALEL